MIKKKKKKTYKKHDRNCKSTLIDPHILSHRKWLGLHSSDVQKLPLGAALPMSSRDRALQASLLKRDEVQQSPIAEELKAMDRKFELEALHTADGEKSHMASEFIPQKIQNSAWI